mgnify:CR=1 FL=1
MAVECIKKYRQSNGNDILKVILKPTQKFPKGFFYCDASDEELVRQYTWCLRSRKEPYVVVAIGGRDSHQTLLFHQEKAYNILDKYPDYINHINSIEFDNVNINLDKVSQQQNLWCKLSKGHYKDKRFRSFVPYVAANYRQIRAKCVRTEVEAIQSAYQLEVGYEDYMYSFLKDRRNDLDILDLERTGQISEEEAIHRHVLRHAADNAWFYYRYSLAEYFRNSHLKVPDYAIDEEGYMTHPITGQKLCPL